MQIDQAQYARITNPRIRQRTLTLPVRKGPLGNRIPCPLRDGSVRDLQARVPYDENKATSERQPTRGRAVLALIDLCDERRRTTKITVTGPPKIETIDGQPVYVVRFVKGDQAASSDRSVFLAKAGSNYTFSPSRQAIPGEAEVSTPFVKDLERARREAGERRAAPQRVLIDKMRNDADTLHRAMTDMKLRNRARRIAHDLERLALELPSSVVVDSLLRPACDEPHMDADSTLSRGALETPEAA